MLFGLFPNDFKTRYLHVIYLALDLPFGCTTSWKRWIQKVCKKTSVIIICCMWCFVWVFYIQVRTWWFPLLHFWVLENDYFIDFWAWRGLYWYKFLGDPRQNPGDWTIFDCACFYFQRALTKCMHLMRTHLGLTLDICAIVIYHMGFAYFVQVQLVLNLRHRYDCMWCSNFYGRNCYYWLLTLIWTQRGAMVVSVVRGGERNVALIFLAPARHSKCVCVCFCYPHHRDSGTPSSEVFLVRVTPTSWHLGLFLYICNKNAVAQLIFIKNIGWYCSR